MLNSVDVSNVAQRDQYFLFYVDSSEATCNSSSATRYLDKNTYLTTDDTIEYVHPYAFFSKVKKYDPYTPTYKDILRLPEEERKLWDAAMVR